MLNFSIPEPIPSVAPTIDCTNPSLPINVLMTLKEGVCCTCFRYKLYNILYYHVQAQESIGSAIPLTPPLTVEPTITYTTASGRNGSAQFVSDSYELTDPVENDVYTFNVTVTNVAGSTSVISEAISGEISINYV